MRIWRPLASGNTCYRSADKRITFVSDRAERHAPLPFQLTGPGRGDDSPHMACWKSAGTDGQVCAGAAHTGARAESTRTSRGRDPQSDRGDCARKVFLEPIRAGKPRANNYRTSMYTARRRRHPVGLPIRRRIFGRKENPARRQAGGKTTASLNRW